MIRRSDKRAKLQLLWLQLCCPSFRWVNSASELWNFGPFQTLYPLLRFFKGLHITWLLLTWRYEVEIRICSAVAGIPFPFPPFEAHFPKNVTSRRFSLNRSPGCLPLRVSFRFSLPSKGRFTVHRPTCEWLFRAGLFPSASFEASFQNPKLLEPAFYLSLGRTNII